MLYSSIQQHTYDSWILDTEINNKIIKIIFFLCLMLGIKVTFNVRGLFTKVPLQLQLQQKLQKNTPSRHTAIAVVTIIDLA